MRMGRLLAAAIALSGCAEAGPIGPHSAHPPVHLLRFDYQARRGVISYDKSDNADEMRRTMDAAGQLMTSKCAGEYSPLLETEGPPKPPDWMRQEGGNYDDTFLSFACK